MGFRGFFMFLKINQFLIDLKIIFYVLQTIKNSGGFFLFFHINYLISFWLFQQIKQLKQFGCFGLMPLGFLSNFKRMQFFKIKRHFIFNLRKSKKINGCIILNSITLAPNLLNEIKSFFNGPLFFFGLPPKLKIKKLDYLVYYNDLNDFKFLYYLLSLFLILLK